jgi:hypothetical protein
MFFLSFIDMTVTYFLLRRVRSAYQKYEPGRDWIAVEQNYVGVFFIRKFGLEIGTIVTQFCIWGVLALVAYLPLTIFHYVFIDGMFFGVIYSNIMNLVSVGEYEKKELLRREKNATKYQPNRIRQNFNNFG